MGYRTPLSLFESQHGTNEYGFEQAINRVEKSISANYSLSYTSDEESYSISMAKIRLAHMAYGQETSQAVIFKNSDQAFDLSVLGFYMARKINADLELQINGDWFIMPRSYQEKLPIASQESRLRFISDYHLNKHEFVMTATWIGPRDLKRYTYDKNYNRLVFDDDLLEDVPLEPKGVKAPWFMTFDFYYSFQLSTKWVLFGGINNLLNYTQTKFGESPLSWRVHGNHAHLDNRHIWGPNQGRVGYAGIKADF
jgi:hypothetical protein